MAQSASQARADIQAGKTGDKTPGFDPAAAPMETDAEAGGASAPEPGSAVSQPTVAPKNVNSTSYASAMRPNGKQARSRMPAYLVGAIIALLAIAAIWLALT